MSSTTSSSSSTAEILPAKLVAKWHLSQAMAWSLVVGHALNLVLDKVSATSVHSLGIAAS
jgi:hypothetical protein